MQTKITLLLFALITLNVKATTYYVDQKNSSANDANPGTVSQPWLTLDKATNTVLPNDIVIVKTGTYKEQVDLFPPHAGLAGQMITFKVNGTDKVIIDGENTRSVGFRTGAYVRIEGFEIINVAGNGITAGGFMSGNYYPPDGVEVINNTVHNCGSNENAGAIYFSGDGGGCLAEGNEMYNNTGDGLFFSIAHNGITIRNNEIHDNDVDGIKGSAVGLLLIENNKIYRQMNFQNHGDGVQLGGCQGDVLIRNNILYDNTQDLFLEFYGTVGLNHVPHLWIYNNLIYNSDPGPNGLAEIGFANGLAIGHNHPIDSVFICNNTIINMNDGSGGFGDGYANYPFEYLCVKNNIFYNSLNGINLSGSNSIDLNYNLYYNAYRGWYLPGYTNFTNFRSANPQYEVNGINADPFMNFELTSDNPISNPDFLLRSVSPAIGTGQDLSAVIGTTDLSGNTRPANSWDIGAYQYQAATGINAVIENKNSFDVYPNPVSGKIYFANIPAEFSNTKMEVLNAQGQKVLEKYVNVNSEKGLDVSELSSGIYFVRLTNVRASINKKIIISN